MTHVFADLAALHGGGHARSALTAYLADDVGRLLTQSSPERLHRHVLSAVAQLTHLLASMSGDAGYHGLAQHYYHTALSLAHEADDDATYAITLRAMSVQALRLGHLGHAADLAESAVDTAGASATPAIRSFLLAQLALTHAVARHCRPALAELSAAEHQHDRATGPPGPFSTYPRAGLDYQRAKTFQALGRPDQAVAAFQDAARHRSPQQRKSYALTHAGLAEALLRTDRLEAACSHWHTFLDHYPHLHSTQANQALTRMHQQLSSFPSQPQATAVRERAHTLLRPRPHH